MKKHYQHILGIDVSKKTFDLSLVIDRDKQNVVYEQFENNAKSIRRIGLWLKKYNIEWDRVLVCMEFTGIYNRPMLQFCTLKKIAVWMIMPIEIIRSMGIQRGKNDKIDSKKIDMYAILHHDKIKVWQPVSKNIVLLKDLLALRQRLIKVSKILLQPINELKAIKDKVAAKETEVHCKSSIEQLKKELHKTEARIKKIITEDEVLQKNYNLLLTIPGIGAYTALDLVCYTNNFEYYQEAKQLACYAGTAPFEHSSGTSVRGKTRVSKMANQSLKTNLTLGAWSVIRTKGFLRKYYERKLDEGKAKMLVVNAVRNKLLHIASAVIKNQMPFDRNYSSPLAS